MSVRDELVAKVRDTIWDALERVDERFGLVDRESGIIDTGVDMDVIAGAVVSELFGAPPVSIVDSRPVYMLAIRAQALDEVQELIQPGDEPWSDPPLPNRELWDRIVAAAFPPPPMA